MFVPSPPGCVWTIELLSKRSTIEGVCRSILLIHPPKECSKWQLANYGDIREDTPILVNKPPQQNVVFPGMEEDRVSGSKWRNFDSHKFYALKLLDLSLRALAQPQLISVHNPLDYYYNKVAHCSQKMLHKKVISEPYFAIHIINFYSLPRENAFSPTPKNSLMYLLAT